MCFHILCLYLHDLKDTATQGMVASPMKRFWIVEMCGSKIILKWLNAQRWCSNKNDTKNGNVSLHTGRKLFASGACAWCGGDGEVQRSPELLARCCSDISSRLPACSRGSSRTASPPSDPQPYFLRVASSAWLLRFLQGCCKLLLSINYPVIQGDCGPPFDALAFSHIHLHGRGCCYFVLFCFSF